MTFRDGPFRLVAERGGSSFLRNILGSGVGGYFAILLQDFVDGGVIFRRHVLIEYSVSSVTENWF